MKFTCKFMAALCVLAAAGARAQETIVITKPTAELIRVSLRGFSGEAAATLAFDLSVVGMKVTDDNPEYIVSGRNDGNVQGALTTPDGKTVFARAYSGGDERAEAHSLADDVVKELRQTAPIFHTRIAFRCQRGGATEIYLADYDGANATAITADNTLIGGPCWMAGDRKLLYPSWKNGSVQIWEHEVATGSRRVFAGHPGSNYSPEASPDGSRVAMVLSMSGSPNLWVCDASGSNLRQLTHSLDEVSSPTWAPDSRQICFAQRRGRARLQIISADGGDARPLRVYGGGVGGDMTSPDWSPDGKQIAFVIGSGSFTICVAPADGGEAQRLVSGEDPCWAPNSRTIVFTRRTREKRILCLLDVPTKEVKDVRQISGSCSEPAWAR